MREKTRKLILSIFLAACIVALMAASLSYTLTNGRYTGGELSEDSPYDDIIDFVGATKYTVSTPEELVNAIENGYSYIEIAEGAEDPFVINSDIADVASNLVLNVNGHIVVRNSRNPLINVQKNVSVVLVYDSGSIDESTPEEDMGGFYNPVGSALQASGGTLTVGQGKYESGPRSSVGSSFNLFTPNYLFTRTSRTADSYAKNTDTSVQVPNITNKQDIYIQPDTTETNNYINDYIKGDTYLIYTEEKNAYIPTEGENAGKLIVNAEEVTGEEGTTTTVSGDEFFVPCNVASCDFYYYYPVAYTESTVGSGDQAQTVQTYAVVYGYNDVKGLASNKDNAAETLQEKGLVWPYAAIRSEAGSAYARGGEFHTYFGTENTYGIYSSGGIMTVGGEASVAPEFSAQGLGTCICMAADSSTEESDNILTIDSGRFSSQIGDTIKMSGGTMNVKAGTFTKSGCKKDTENDQIDNQTAIISLQGGTLNVVGTKSGEENAPVYSVTMKAGGDANGGTLQNVFGIRAVGGGKITTEGVSFDIYGDYSAGVLSYDGTINLGSDTLINVEQSGNTTTVLTSAGVSSEASETQQDHPVNLDGNVTINSNGLGITARGVVNVRGEGVAVTTTRGTGIYVNKGEFNVETGASITVKSTVLSGYSWATPPKSGTTDAPNNEPNIYNGVYVQGGSLVAEGTLNVTFTGVANTTKGYDYTNFETRSYAVRVEGGKGTSVLINKGTITNDKGGGLYVNSSDSWSIGEQNIKDLTFEGISAQDATKVELKAVDISTTGTGTVSTKNIQSNWNYNLYTEGGPAVKVNQGVLCIAGGTYTAKSGDGIRVQGGVAFVEGGYFVGRDYTGNSNRDAYLPGAGASYAFKVFGGHAKVTGGVFGRISENVPTRQGNGAFVMGGTAYITKADIQAGGTTAFSVWTNANVTFNGTNEDIQVIGDSTGLAIETGGTSPVLSVTINGGTFKGTDENNTNTNGIWYGNSNAKLTIINGYFEGARRSGLRIDSQPNTNNMQLSGGEFVTGQRSGYNAISGSSYLNYSQILASGARAYAGNDDLSNQNINNGEHNRIEIR